MEVVGRLGDSYEEAFYAVSQAYIESAKNMSTCNIRTRTALKQLEDAERIYDNTKK